MIEDVQFRFGLVSGRGGEGFCCVFGVNEEQCCWFVNVKEVEHGLLL